MRICRDIEARNYHSLSLLSWAVGAVTAKFYKSPVSSQEPASREASREASKEKSPDKVENVEHVGHLLCVPALVLYLEHVEGELEPVDVAALLEECLIAGIVPE